MAEKKAEKEDPKNEAVEAKAQEKAEKKADKKTEAGSEEPVQKKVRVKRRHTPVGNAYVHASYNNTIVTLTDPAGSVISWSSAGASGFKGARKSTPYAAQVAAENAAEKSKLFGLEKIHVFVKGVGAGREQAIRGLVSNGLELISISDVTPIPHNGCRKKKQRRV